MSDFQPHRIRRLLDAGVYAWQGINSAARSEAAFREELYGALIFIPVAFWLDISTVERILLVGVILLLLIVELLNSALEAAIDRIGTERHPLSGKTKDIGAAAVLFALILVVFTWTSILWEQLG